MFRKTSGSSLCYACGKLNRVDAAVCFYCGRRNPGLWGFGPALGRLVGAVDLARVVTLVCVVAYLASLALDPGAIFHVRGVFSILAPSGRALYVLGMTGADAMETGRWWTLFTAIYLHGSLLHIAFNLLWIRDLAPPVEELYGRARAVVIFTAGGVGGFLLSNWLGVGATIGASGAVFGLLGAMVAYGRRRGGFYGMAVFRQYWQWTLVLLVMGFFMPGVNNLAHAGGFAGGFAAAFALGYAERRSEGGADRILAALTVLITVVAFALAIGSAFRSVASPF